MTTSDTPQHGDERNRGEVTRYGSHVTYTTPDGAVAYRGPMSSSTATESERYCATCGEWKHQRGILAGLLGCPDCKREWR
jgi:hypothetical protein